MAEALFYVLGALSVLFAIGVVRARMPWLLVTLCGVSGSGRGFTKPRP